jgi:two-component system, OmpR family, response regulator
LTSNSLADRRPVLLVEDEREFGFEIKSELENRGHLVLLTSLAEAADLARIGDAALLILGRPIFGVDCLPTLRMLRNEGIKTPVLVISIMSSVDERVRGLKAGGDDYLAKPFAMAELGARVEALLRRLDGARLTKLGVDDVELDLIERIVYCAGTKIELSSREFDILEYFLRRPGRVITQAMLLQDVWKYHFSIETNVVDTHISNLRKKIDTHDVPSRILSIRKAGYMLRVTHSSRELN